MPPFRCWNRFCTVLFAVVLLSSLQAAAADIFVSTSGNDANPGTALSPIKTLKEAVNRANASPDVTTLNFLPGTYTETTNIHITESTTILGAEAVLDALVFCDATVSMYGMAIKTRGFSYSLLMFNGGTVENCTFIGDPQTANLGTIAILLASDLPIEISGCDISDFGVGIEVQRGTNVAFPGYVLRSNHFMRCLAGVLATSSIVDGGTTDAPGGNIFEECDTAIGNVRAFGQVFVGCQFLLRDEDTGVLYGLTNINLIYEKQVTGVKQQVLILDPIPSEIGGAGPQDVNQDGAVNAIDIQLIINGALFGGIGFLDVNQDGQINAVDVQLVINRALT